MGMSAGKKGGGEAFGKGAGKGNRNAAGKTAGAVPAVDRTCQREGCRAAFNQQATWGGATACHCCGLSLTATLPVEQLVGWAFEKRLQAKADNAQAQTTGAAPQPKAKAKAAGSAPKASATAEDLAAKRSERLAALKEAEKTAAAPPKDTPTQEVAKVFVDQVQVNKTYELDAEDLECIKGMDARAKQLLGSLAAEHWPSEVPLKTPQDIVEGCLAKSSSFQKDQGRTAADAALQTARAVLTTMRSGGTQEDDELLLAMVAREKKLAQETKRLEDKAPSKELRLATMGDLKANWAKSAQAQADGRTAGAAKAVERAAARLVEAEKLLVAATRLKALALEASEKLQAAHVQRTASKDQQGEEVIALFDLKLAEVESEDAIFEDAAAEPDATTQTEDDRDEALRLTRLLEQQLQQLRQAAAVQPAAQPAPVEAAAPAPPSADGQDSAARWNDLFLEFEATAEQLPTLGGTPTGDQKNAVDLLLALFLAVPWGSSLPSVQFSHLGVHPCFMHGLVGDVIWQACWGDRHASITEEHAVPYKLLNLVRHVVESLNTDQTEVQRVEGRVRYQAVHTAAASRRRGGSPY